MAYTRVNWQDLPSTSTPRNATNLNNMDAGIKTNDDKLLGNAPMGDIVVESIKSKNLLNVNGLVSGNISNSTGELQTNYGSTIGSVNINTGAISFTASRQWGGVVSEFIKTTSGEKFTLSFNGNNTNGMNMVFFYNSSKAYLSLVSYLYHNYSNNENWTFTIPSNSNIAYIRIVLEDARATPSAMSLTSIQLEKGQTKTDFSSNQELNNQEIYSTGEIVVGKWIDGKPIYRKVYTLEHTAPYNSGINHGLTNIDKIWINQEASFIYKKDGSSIESLGTSWFYSTSDWVRTWVNQEQIRINANSDYGTRTLYCVLEYTKTTD